MTADEATCWTLIHAAAEGDRPARDEFARLYEPIARSYLSARWRHSGNAVLDDAVQDFFVECFRAGGILAKIDESHSGGFRAFFFGAVRNIALCHESKRPSPGALPPELAADDTSLAAAFDRAWAKSLLKEAGRVQADMAKRVGERAVRRVELLRLRFREGLAIREIAVQWATDAALLHREYATARDEFRAALRSVVAFHHPNAGPSELDAACVELLSLLG